MNTRLKSQAGQAVLEGVLLLSILMFTATTVTKYLQDKKVAAKLVEKPWSRLAGMIECGVWEPCGSGLHPQTTDRLLSLSASGK